MFRGNLRRTIAVGLLAMCLVMALPDSAQARQVELPSHPDQAEFGIEDDFGFWHELWRRIEAIWAWSSVLIIPEGSSVLIIPEG